MIGGLAKVTVQDFPGNLACIVFFNGCNFRCPYCHNSELVNKKAPEIPVEEIMDYIRKRKNMLDGVVISGGEPTVNKELIDFIKEIKKLKLKVKLDTNGYLPSVLKEIIDNKLVDYIAMDIKEVFSKYKEVVGLDIDTKKIKESIKLIKDSKIEHEFRTTMIKEIHTIDDIKEIVKIVGDSPYYLQNFKESEYVLAKNLHGFSHDELIEISKLFKKNKNVNVRGI